MRIIGLLLFFPSFCMMLLGIFSIHQDLSLRHNGETTFARVISKNSSDAQSANFEPSIDYKFSIEVEKWMYLSRYAGCLPVDIKAKPIELKCEAREALSESDFLTVEVGQKIPVFYQYNSKNKNLRYRILEFNPIKAEGVFNFIFGLIMILIISILAIRHVRDSWRVSEDFEDIQL